MDTPAAPALCTRRDVELLAAGTWNLSTGEATFTPEDLASAVSAAGCPSVGSPVLKLGHTDTRFSGDGEPAIGRVVNMALADSGNKITGDLSGMPGWLGDVLPSAYPERSIEGAWDFVCQSGHVHNFVITAVALLGVTPEAAAHRERVAAAAAAGARPWELKREGETVLAAGVTTEDVRRAYYAGPAASNYSLWITELQLDPPQLIVADEADAKVYRVPVQISGTDVTFGDAVEVSVEYVDVPEPEKTAAARVTWASRDASRLVMAWSAAVQEKNLGTDPSSSQIKALYALPASTKSDSKLPHHTVGSDGKVGAADDTGCSAAIAAINGGRGGLKGVSAADLKKAYSHLAAHLKADGKDVPDYSGPAASAKPDPEAAGKHGAMTVTHSHEHGAYGAQGGDQVHTYEHTHTGDATHSHAHAKAGATPPRGAAEMDFSDEQLAALRTKLGKADDYELTPEEILAAVTEPGAPITASRVPAGAILLDREEWEAAQKQIRDGVAAREEQLRSQRDHELDKAIQAGKFQIARRGHWERVWEADPEGTKAVLASLTPGVVPVADIGQPGGPGDEMPDEFAGLFPPEPARRAG